MNITTTINPVSMTSIELLDLVNEARAASREPKIRANVFADRIKDELDGEHYKSFVVQNLNGTQSEVFELNRDQCMLVSMRESKAVRRKVLAKLNALEAKLSHPVTAFVIPKTMSEALRLAADQAEQIEKQQAVLSIAAPKAEFVDRYVDGTGLKGFRQVAKLLGAKENDFRAFLQDKRVMYRLGGEWVPFAEHIAAGRFSVKTGQADNGHAFNAAKFTPKGVQWIAGLWAVHQLEAAA